jgi:hypothetical protein
LLWWLFSCYIIVCKCIENKVILSHLYCVLSYLIHFFYLLVIVIILVKTNVSFIIFNEIYYKLLTRKNVNKWRNLTILNSIRVLMRGNLKDLHPCHELFDKYIYYRWFFLRTISHWRGNMRCEIRWEVHIQQRISKIVCLSKIWW